MTHGLLTVGFFLFSLVFSFLLMLLWVRIYLRFERVSTLHPVSQLIYRLTNPWMKPVEQLFIQQRKSLPQYDWVCFAFIVVLELVKFIILGLLAYRQILPLSYLLVFVIADLIVQPLNLLFYALLIRIIMSWVRPDWRNPVADLLNLITNPLIRFGHRIVPDISGFDFAPYIMMIGIKVVVLFISASMPLPLL